MTFENKSSNTSQTGAAPERNQPSASQTPTGTDNPQTPALAPSSSMDPSLPGDDDLLVQYMRKYNIR
jgi:hypothetical protein